jgi:2-methylfumaryl-CoA hydratase
MDTKTNLGNYFEDFQLGQVIHHATPRTIRSGDVSLYIALYGSRFSLASSDAFAQANGLPSAPVDDLLAFHVVFGKTVPNISLNAIANLGYADGRFHRSVYSGDTLSAASEVIGLKENSNGKAGVVYVRSTGINQRAETVLDYVRWVMVRKRDEASPARGTVVPELPDAVAVDELIVPTDLDFARYDDVAAGSPHRWEDYEVGEKIDHVDGMTIEEAEHMMATRLYQNTAKVHFNQHTENDGRFGRRLIYGGHIISVARALSFNGLANACLIVAVNSGQHVAPTFAGDTIYAWSKVLERHEIPDRKDLGALRLRTVAVKNTSCETFPEKRENGDNETGVVLEFDYTVLMPRRR